VTTPDHQPAPGADPFAAPDDAPASDAPETHAAHPAHAEGDAPPVLTGPRGAVLARRLEELEGALARAGTRIAPDVHREVRRRLDAVGERLVLGVDTTVVALVGGTGSGKSSLVNAISGLRFAEVGVRRPTTSQAAAVTWGEATALLDWLGVPLDRRIERESALDADSQADLRGLVLLDLPDHDSVEPEHRAVVDRLLPMVDLLVWVVDPQKYADDVLHSGYLRHLAGHEERMLVVLNQADTVPVGQQAALLADVARLLEEDGLESVPVHAVSARTGDGVPVLREALARAVAGRSQAETAATAELDDAARLVRDAVGSGEAGDLPRDTTVAELLDAAGVPAAAEAVRRGEGLEAVGPLTPQVERVARVLQEWVTTTTPGLPDRWRRAVEAGLVPAETLRDDVAGALATVHEPEPRPEAERRGRSVALWLAVLGVLAVVGAVVAWSVAQASVVAAAAGGAGLLALAGAVVARSAAGRARAADVERRAHEVVEAARAAVATVVDTRLVAPTLTVLADHRDVREAVAADRAFTDDALAAPPAGDVAGPSASSTGGGTTPSSAD